MDASFFFGRAKDIEDLADKLKETSFLAVIGASGSGKSSLVRAGLIPALRKGLLHDSGTWKFHTFTPGVKPLEALAVGISQLGLEKAMGRMIDEMNADKREFHLHTMLALSKRPAEERAVWVVDQFEEVFTLCRSKEERSSFIDNLLFASSVPNGRSVVLLTMRADFYHRCLEHAGLARAIADHQYAVVAMNEENLRQAIDKPARQVGLSVEPELTNEILAEVRNQPGALPLLEHALYEVWERRSEGWLTLTAYKDSGGVKEALSKRAEAIYESLSASQQEIARRVMLRLTQPGEGTDDTRRRARMSELATHDEESEAVAEVVGALADARLLTTSKDEQSQDQMVDVSHEALIRGWPRLRQWVEEDRAGLRTLLRLSEAAQEWQREKYDEGLLYRGARLAVALEWSARNSAKFNKLERDFLRLSDELKNRDEQERERQRQRDLEIARRQAEFEKQRAEAEKQRAEAQRENEERLRMAIEAANAGSFDWDIDSGVVVWTPGRHRYHSVEQDYQSWRATVYPQDIDRVEAEIAKCLAERRDLYIEYRILRPNGSVRWVSNIGHAFYDEAGQAVRMKGLRIDLTDRKRAEEMLRESEERLRLALEGAKAGVWEVKFDPYSAYWSKEYRDLFGFSETDEATNELWATRIHPNDLQRVVDANNELLSSEDKEIGRQEFRIIHPEHGERWILDFVRVRRDQAGRPVSFGGINLDVTDRKRAEEAMHKSDGRFRELVEAIPDVFWIMHPESQALTYLSPACERLWGRTAADLNGSLDMWFDAIHTEDRERVRKKYLARAGEGDYDETYRVVRPDGSMVWVHDRGFPVYDEAGNILHIVGVAEDITERKRAEEAVRENEERLRQAAQAGGFGLYSVNLRTGENYWSPELRRIFGLSDSEAVVLDSSLGLIHPDDREETMRVIEAALDPGGDGEFEHEFRAQLSDGSIRWALARGKTLFADNGRRRKAARIIGVAFDITGRKEAEERLPASEELFDSWQRN